MLVVCYLNVSVLVLPGYICVGGLLPECIFDICAGVT